MAIQLKNKSYTPATPSVSLTAFTASGNMVMNGITIYSSGSEVVNIYVFNAADATTTQISTKTAASGSVQVLSAPLGMQSGDKIYTNVSATGPTLVFSYALSTTNLSGVALDALSDVNAPSPSLNDSLVWNGSVWSSQAVSGGGSAAAYEHTQASSSTSWVITHNLDLASPLVQVYDSTGEQVEPASIVATSSDVVTITFGAAMTGSAVVAGGLMSGNGFTNITFVNSVSDLPTPVSGVITLEADKTYFITGDVDLNGDRLVGSSNTTIIGGSSENCKITSTGLSTGVALFTTAWTTPIRHVTFYDVDTAIDIEGATNAPVALDWTGVNFLNVPNVGTIDTCDNWIYSKGALLNSKGLVFDGTVGTVGIDNSIFVGSGAAGSLIEVASTCTITRRFRTIYSSVVAFGSTTGVDVDSSATVPVEGFILDTVNFSGGSTYLPDIDHTSNASRFDNCKGVTNTAVNGQMYMTGNSTVTAISVINTFYKVAGTTSASADNAKFTHTSNRLTCDATVPRKFLIQAHLSFSSANNKDIEFGFYDSTLAAVRAPSITKATTDGAGKAQNVGLACVTTMESGDYIEIHTSNTSGTSNVTVNSLNVLITEI